MQEKSLNVYIITRFGLGQSQKSFYEREFIYLEKFLAKSIQKAPFPHPNSRIVLPSILGFAGNLGQKLLLLFNCAL